MKTYLRKYITLLLDNSRIHHILRGIDSSEAIIETNEN